MPDIPTLTAEVDRLTGAVGWWNAAILVMMVVAAVAATGLVATQYLAFKSVEVRYGLRTMGFLQHTPEPAGPDVMGLAKPLIRVFQDAGWQIPLAPFMSTLQGPPGLTIDISSLRPPLRH
jgi:hypothetical protein